MAWGSYGLIPDRQRVNWHDLDGSAGGPCDKLERSDPTGRQAPPARHRAAACARAVAERETSASACSAAAVWRVPF
jgi:hypothetical protein